MTTNEVSARFNELAQQNNFKQILEELFSTDATSIEPPGSPFPTVAGLENIIEKGNRFHAIVEEMHDGWTSAPLVAGNYFTCIMGMEVTIKGMGRQKFEEVALYYVKDGKIKSEQFFF